MPCQRLGKQIGPLMLSRDINKMYIFGSYSLSQIQHLQRDVLIVSRNHWIFCHANYGCIILIDCAGGLRPTEFLGSTSALWSLRKRKCILPRRWIGKCSYVACFSSLSESGQKTRQIQSESVLCVGMRPRMRLRRHTTQAV